MKIYEGEEAIGALGRQPYYSTILMKVIFVPDTYEMRWHPFGDSRYKFHAEICKEDRLNYNIDQMRHVNENEVYIVSVFNRFHSQLMMPKILTIHFNCTRKEMIEYWKAEQSCWYQDKNDLVYDENGNVIS